jgi:drug/metabolite transporter (DMT)-like permease
MMPATALQWGVLLWLGFAASGVGLFLWNKGATMVDAGTLAIMNNMLIPAGILVNILFWNKDADLFRLAVGGLLILLSLWINSLFRNIPAQIEARV